MGGGGMPQAGLSDPVVVTERVLDEARRTYQGLDAGVLERVVNQAVADLWTDTIAVTSFVPVLAMRRIREVVEAEAMGAVELAGAVATAGRPA